MSVIDSLTASLLRAAHDHGDALNRGSSALSETRINIDTLCSRYAVAQAERRREHNAQHAEHEAMDLRVKSALIELRDAPACSCLEEE